MKEKLAKIIQDAPDGKKERERIYNQYGDLLPKAYGYQILCKTYLPKSVSSGGVILPHQVAENSAYQNMVGLVLDMGSACYKGQGEKYKYWDKLPDLGDWIIMPRFEHVLMTFIGWNEEEESKIEKVELRYVFDDRVLGTCIDPSRIGGAHILGN